MGPAVSQFGVSAVRWSDDLSEVVECRVHTMVEADGWLRLTGGAAYPFAHLAEVAAVGDDEIWFLLKDARGFPRPYARMEQDGRLRLASDNLLRDLPIY